MQALNRVMKNLEEAATHVRLMQMSHGGGQVGPADAQAKVAHNETEHPDASLKRRVDNDFSYHVPTPTMLPKFAMIRNRGKELANLLVELVPEGRERCIALTRLEEVVMHANAGIARQGTKV